MHIGLFMDTYHPCIDGAVTAFDNLSLGLESLGHRVTKIVPYHPGYVDVQPEKVIRLSSFDFIFYRPYRLPYPFAGRSIPWDELQLDIIHAHSPFTAGGIAKKYAYKLNVPFLYTFHTLYPDYVHYIRLIGPFLKQWAEKTLAHFGNSTDTIIAPSKAFGSLMRKWGATKPIEWLPTGLLLDRFKGVDPAYVRAKHGVPESKKIIMYAGRLGKEKNLELTLRAIHQLKQQRDDFVLFIVGKGQDESRLRNLARQLEIDSLTTFVGFLDQEELREYYLAASAFVMTSLTDNQPMVLIEAMINRTPVVGVNVLGIPDMITHEENGLLAEPNVDDVTFQLMRLFSDQDLRTRLEEGAYQFASKQDYIECAKRHINLYERLILAKKDALSNSKH